MKKVIYVMWLVIAIGLGSLITVLNGALLILPFVLGGMGTAAVVAIVGLFIIAVYKVWTGRGIWSDNETHEKNI
jgi:hypothetical protein